MEAHARPRREFNDDRKRIFGGTDRVIAFICECADPACSKTVLLTAGEYDATRPDLVVHQSHQST